MRLDEKRTTVVRRIELPEDEEAHKFVREAVRAFPELYFSPFVVLGEGDSEEVVLPRLLAAEGILADDASISVVPLGGRHVNHFWRLLQGLGIPHVTLLDLDLARYQGGWGRIKYAARQLLAYRDVEKSGFKNARDRRRELVDDLAQSRGKDVDAAAHRGFLVADAVPANQSPIIFKLARREKFPGISQFIRELARFLAFGRLLTLRKPLRSRANLNPAA